MLSVGVVLGPAAAPDARAAGAPFQRGDILVSGAGGIARYTPSGTLEGTLPGSSGAGSLCLAPDGDALVAPGVGLFDSSGDLLPSNWASDAPPLGECTVDGFGHVYVGNRSSTLFEFDLTGNLLRSYTVGGPELAAPWNLDLAPDQCTVYYHGDPGSFGIRRFNVCTNTQEPAFTAFGANLDQLRIRPNGQVLQVDDSGWLLFAASGPLLSGDLISASDAPSLRVLSLDPDGTSFWIGPIDTFPPEAQSVGRVDISTGQLLTQWAAPGGVGALAVYAPPLLGTADIGDTPDYNPAGTAEAFVERVRYSGQMKSLNLYVDPSSTASQAILGVYSDRNGHPGALQTQATIANVVAGSWNDVSLPPMSVTAGQRVWVALLGPDHGGTIRFRDATSGDGSETSAQHRLTALPARWSTGVTYTDGHLAAYGN